MKFDTKLLSEDHGEVNVKKWIGVTKVFVTLLLLMAPFIISMLTWKVLQINNLNTEVEQLHQRVTMFSEPGPRYTKADARQDSDELKKDILNYVSTNYAPQWLRDKVEENKINTQILQRDLKAFESEFTSDFIRKEELDTLLRKP